MPEAGLAKNRMKQYLETSQKAQMSSHQQQAATSNVSANGEVNEQLPEKGSARSLLAKWKSIENLKDRETSPELNGVSTNGNSNPKQTSPFNSNSVVTEADNLPSGIAKNLLNKWQNIEKEKDGNDRSSPPSNGNGQHGNGEDFAQIEKGFAKNVLAK